MADIQLLLEAERRGLLPPDKKALLDEARRRGLIQDAGAPAATTQASTQTPPQAAPERPGLIGSFKESMETLGLADEAAVYAANPTIENRKKFLDAAKSKYESVGFGQGENWEAFKEMLGSSLGQMVAPIVAATAGSLATPIAGAVAGTSTIASQYGIQNLLRQAQEQEQAVAEGKAPQDLSLGKAALATAGETALDVVQFNKFKALYEAFPLVRNLVGGGKGAKEATEAIVDAAKEGTLKTTKRGIVTGAAKGVAFEVPQEVAQQALERWQAGLSVTDADAMDEFKQAAIGAALLGPIMGGAEGYLDVRKERREADAKELGLDKTGEEGQTETTQKKVTPEEGSRRVSVLNAIAASGLPTKASIKKVTGLPDLEVQAELNALKNEGVIKYGGSQKGWVFTDRAAADAARTKAESVDLGMLTTGQFVPGGEAPSGAVTTTPADETVDTTVGRGAVVPPSGIGTAEPSVAGPEGQGLETTVSPPNAPDVREGELSPALTGAAKPVEATPAEPTEFKVPSIFNYYVTNAPAYEGVEPLSSDDADFELEVLEAKANKGKLKPVDFANSEIGKRLDTTALMAVNEGIKTDPVATIQALRQDIQSKQTTKPVEAAKPAEAPAVEAAKPVEAPVVEAAKPVEAPAVEAAKPVAAAKQELSYKPSQYGQWVHAALRFAFNGKQYSLEPSANKQPRLVIDNYRGGDQSPIDPNVPDNENAIFYKNAARIDDRANIYDAKDIGRIAKFPPELTEAINNWLDASEANRDAAGQKVADVLNDFNSRAAETTTAEAEPTTTMPRSLSERDILATARLNENTAPVVEQDKGRSPSLRVEINRAKRDLDAGKIDPDAFANRAEWALKFTQKKREVRTRQRGADFIRERLMNAARKGFISHEEAELASWFIQQNPSLADDLGISIKTRPKTQEGIAGFYNDISRIVVLFKEHSDEHTAVHEILHHLERLMPAEARAGILKAYAKQLLKAQKAATTNADKAFFDAVVKYHFENGSKVAYNAAIKSIEDGKASFSNYQYINPSEFWAVNGSRIVDGRYGTPSTVTGQIKRWIREFIQKLKSVFGLKSDAAIIRALDSLAKADGKYQTSRLLSESDRYAALQPKTAAPKTKAAGPTDNKGRTPAEAIKARQDTYKERFSKKSLVDRMLRYLNGKDSGPARLNKYEALVRKFQNDLRPALTLERELKRAGELITFGPGMNDAYTKISAAQDKAAWLTSTRLKQPMDAAYKAIESYARSRNLTTDQAIEELDRFRIVLHEPERRLIMFMRYVPLSTKRRAFKDSNGKTIQISPAEIRDSILQSLVKPGNDLVSNGQAKQLHNVLKALVSDPANLDPLGASPIKKEGKPLSTDINDDQYSVLAGYSPAFIKQWGDSFNALGRDKAGADAAIKAIEKIQDVTKELNRMGGYWSKPVDNIVEFYNFAHYTPFKGVPGTRVRAEAEMTDPNDVRISGEFADADQAMEGRETEADNSVLQSFSDALYAASRAGRAGVTEAVKNLIEQGHISGKKIAEITHEQRWLDKDFNLRQYKGSNKLFHYNEDGNIEVYQIANKDLGFLESIRRPYQVDNWTTKMANSITGIMGQLHTRFNPSFAPLNFPRDVFTNTMAISADVGGKEAMSYLSDALFHNVMKGGLQKSAKVSKLLSEGNIEELRRLAKDNPFYADTLELLEEGGRTAYKQATTLQAQADALEDMLAPNGVVKSGKAGFEAIGKWADMYNDAFEFTNRVAAYGVMKNNISARLKKEFREKNRREPNAQELAQINKAARTEGAAFSKNLANFRLVGTAGRQAGGLFMFFRASATGAVRAIDSLMPAFVDEKTALSQAPASIRDNPQAVQKYLKNYRENKSRAQWTMFTVAAAGAALYTMALVGSGDDDQGRNKVATDDMARWTRYARLPILGKNTVLQIPWGFGISAFGALGAQVAALASGNQSAKEMAANTINIAFDSFIPLPKSNINIFDNFTGFLVDSVTPTMLRPFVEFAMNTDNLGNEIYNSRQAKYSDAFTGGTNVPELYKDISKGLLESTGLDISPNSLYFWMSNYADSLSRVATSAYDVRLFASGDRELRSVDDLDRVLLPFDSFIGTKSNYDGRQYEAVKNQIEDKRRVIKSLESRPEAFKKYVDENPTDLELVDFYNNAVNGELKYLQENSNQIKTSRELSSQQKRDMLKENTRMQNLVKRNLIDTFKMYGVKP